MGQTSLVYKNIKFDSDEEVYVAMWLEELRRNGIVESWERTTEPWQLTHGLKIKYVETKILKTKIKRTTKEKVILRPSEYTPDFKIVFSRKTENNILFPIHTQNDVFNPNAIFYTDNYPCMFLEVKPSFDQNNMERLFVNNQKFIWRNIQLFVNLTEPMSLFKKTFLPREAETYFKYKKSPTGKNKGKKGPGDWKMDWVPKTLKEYLNGDATA